MKTIKIVLLLLAFSAVTFYSCSDSDPIEKKTASTQESVALRTMLNEMKSNTAVMGGKPAKAEGKTALTNPFCFEFVYPITLSFNNNVSVSVANLQGLVDILASESPNLYIEGIAFPFQVTYGGAVHTIANEANFSALIQTCGFNTLGYDLLHTTCFDLVYPISVSTGSDLLVLLNSAEELEAHIAQHPNFGLTIIYPISVNYGGQQVVIHNLYELYDMFNNCDVCICTLEYAPVCVQTPTGIVEYSNMCFAECAGFSQNDLVPCNPTNTCDISNASVTIGACNNDGTFVLTLNFEYGNLIETTFTVRNGNNTLIGTYNLSDLPITIPNYPLSVATVDNLHINMGVNCSESVTFMPPNCPCFCTTEVLPVCVQTPTGIVTYSNPSCAACAGYGPEDFITCPVAPGNFGTQLGDCFNIQYPVGVMTQGQVISVTSNGELLQYWNAATVMPSMVYPITVTFANTIYTFQNQAAFEAAIQANCN